MDSCHIIFSFAFFLSAYGWAREQPTDANYKVMRLLSGSGLDGVTRSLASSFEPRGAFPFDFLSINRNKRRSRRHAQENSDADTFLKLLELAKAVSSANPSSGGATKFRSLDNSEPNLSERRRPPTNRRGQIGWRQNHDEELVEEPKVEWKKPNYEEPWNTKVRSNPEAGDSYQNYWQNRPSRDEVV